MATCGDGIVRAGVEECDDGNDADDDQCTSNCRLARCRDGILASDEACDDGNQQNDDECTAQCEVARCGDGLVRLGVETCDDGNSRTMTVALPLVKSLRAGTVLFSWA